MMRCLQSSVSAMLPTALQRCPLAPCTYHRARIGREARQPNAVSGQHHSRSWAESGLLRQHRRRCTNTTTAAAVAEHTDAPPWAGQPAADRLVLVDASSMMYRMHFGYGVHVDKRLTSQLGEDTTITYGFLNAILNLLMLNPPPTHFAAAFDSGGSAAGQSGKTFRHQLYTEYKAQRASMPEDIKIAGPRVKEVLQAINIATFDVPGVEADDVIGTLSRRAVAEGMQVAIVSTDQDFYQLLGPGVQMLKPPKKGEKALVGGMCPYNIAAFQAEHGVTPQQWPDVKALAGDNSDNIPGVKGIGPKRAASMIAQAGSLEQLLANPDQVKLKSMREALSSSDAAQIARLGLRLVTIQDDLDFPPTRKSLDGLRLRLPTQKERQTATALLDELGFKQAPGRLDKIWDRLTNVQ